MPTIDFLLQHLGRPAERPESAEPTDRDLLAAFALRRDEEAFARLVRRHGPLVLGVCRRLLRHAQDAEDAFQATFLLLARRANSLPWQESVAGWLHEVALRTARKARAESARRRAREADAAARPISEARPEAAWGEVCVVLDEELRGLSDRWRVPSVLCYLQGRTREQAAAQLGVSRPTLVRRLARGRALLAARLGRRGVSLTAALFAAGIAATARAGVPPLLAVGAVNSAVRLAAGASRDAFPPAVLALADGVGAFPQGAARAALAVLLIGLVGLGVGASVFTRPPAREPDAPLKGEEKPKPPRPNDREDEPLPNGAIARLGSVRLRHANLVTSTAFSPDGKVIASGSWDGTVRLWDAATGKNLRVIDAQTTVVYSVAFSGDGKHVAGLQASLPGNKVRVWNVADGKEVRTLDSYTVNSRAVGYAADGKTLLTANTTTDDADTAVTVIDAATKKEILSLSGHKAKVLFASFAADGKTLVSSSHDDTIRRWDLSTGKELSRWNSSINSNGGGGWGNVAVSPDGKTLALGPSDSSLRVWDAATGKERHHLWNRAAAYGLAFAPDNRTLAVGASDHTVTLWDAVVGKEMRPQGGHSRPLLTLAFSPDGGTLATSSADETVRLWETDTGKELRAITGHDHVYELAYSPDGKLMALAGSHPESRLVLFDTATGKERRLDGHAGAVSAAVFTPDGKTLVSGGRDKSVRFWDVATGKEQRRLDGPRGEVRALALTADGKTLLTSSYDVEHGDANLVFRLWDAATGKEKAAPFLGFQGTMKAVALSPDGRTAAVAMSDNTIRLNDVESGNELRRFDRDPRRKGEGDPSTRGDVHFGEPVRYPHDSLAFSPDGRVVASAERDRVLVHEAATGQVRREFGGHLASVVQLAFSRDGRYLASAGMDHAALVWDVTGCAKSWRRQTRQPSQKELDYSWEQLAIDDQFGGEDGLDRLRGAPRQGVALIKERLPPVPKLAAEDMAKLIAKLDDASFEEREKASRTLEGLEHAADEVLRRAAKESTSAEVRRRAEALLDKLDGHAMSGEHLRSARAIELLEHYATEEAKAVLVGLSEGAPEARRTREAKEALRRLDGR